MSEYLGCGSHSCLIEKPKGMGTNGGCSCFGWSKMDKKELFRVKKAYLRLMKENKELKDELESIKEPALYKEKQLRKEIKKFFYPDRFFIGYACLFEPHIPKRIANKFCNDLVQLLKDNNSYSDKIVLLNRLIHFLENSHTKNSREGKVECYPTDQAKEALDMLYEYRKLFVDSDKY